jgi:hypothetical protein
VSARVFLIAVVLASSAATVSPAAAQSRVVLTPSVTVGWVYDDNLFHEAVAEAEAILRVSSGFHATRETARTLFGFGADIDLERFSEHRTLSSPFARQAAMMRVRHQATPRLSFEFDGGADSTRAPTELNLTTGILTGRRRAYRLSGNPSVTFEVTPVSRVSAAYDLNADIVPETFLLSPGLPGEPLETFAPQSRVFTHVASAQYAHGLTPRHELRVDYVNRWFQIGDQFDRPGEFVVTPGATIGTHTALVGWAFRVNPAVRFEAAVGPRIRQGVMNIDGFEAQALLWRQRPTHDLFVSYVRTVTTAIGLSTLIEVDRAILRGIYRPPFGVQLEGETGFYQNTVDEQSVRAFQLSGGVTVPIAGPVSVGATYSIDFQRGRFGVAAPIVVPGSGRMLDPEAPLRRNVAMLRLVIAPQVRRQPEEPPPGAAPIRTPVKKENR